MPWVREDNKEASNAHKAMYCCGKTWLNIDLTCTEVCQAGVSETQQSEPREAVQLRERLASKSCI